MSNLGAVGEDPQQTAHGNHRQNNHQRDDRNRNIAFSLVEFAARVTGARRTHGITDSLDDGGDDLDKSPDCRDGHDAGADVTHLARKDRVDNVRQW